MPPPAIERIQSARRFTIQLFTGAFRPNVDSASELGGAKPFQDVFGTRRPLVTRLEFDVDLFQKFGRLSIGGAVGFWQAVGKARNATTGEIAGDTQLLNLYPLSVLLVYRADFLFEKWRIPFVPYGKFGYGFVPFSNLVGGETVKFTQPGGRVVSSNGWAHGIEYAVGLQFVLDFLDRQRAATLDQEVGINSTSIFVEFGQSRWQADGGLFLGGNIVSGGLLLAF